jgi:chromate transporter
VCIVHIDGYHVDIPPQGRMIASAILLLRYRANSAWLLLGGAILGLMLGK